MISLLTGILLSEKGGEFSQGGKWPIDCLYGGTYISPFWAPLMTIYIYTFFPFKEEGRRRDFTSVRSSKHRPSSSSRSRRRTKDDWAGRRAGCSLRLRVLLLSRNFLTREENFNNFSNPFSCDIRITLGSKFGQIFIYSYYSKKKKKERNIFSRSKRKTKTNFSNAFLIILKWLFRFIKRNRLKLRNDAEPWQLYKKKRKKSTCKE